MKLLRVSRGGIYPSLYFHRFIRHWISACILSRKIGGGGRTKAVINFYVHVCPSIHPSICLSCLSVPLFMLSYVSPGYTEGASDDENEDEEIELARASLSFHNDSYTYGGHE